MLQFQLVGSFWFRTFTYFYHFGYPRHPRVPFLCLSVSPGQPKTGHTFQRCRRDRINSTTIPRKSKQYLKHQRAFVYHSVLPFWVFEKESILSIFYHSPISRCHIGPCRSAAVRNMINSHVDSIFSVWNLNKCFICICLNCFETQIEGLKFMLTFIGCKNLTINNRLRLYALLGMTISWSTLRLSFNIVFFDHLNDCKCTRVIIKKSSNISTVTQNQWWIWTTATARMTPRS